MVNSEIGSGESEGREQTPEEILLTLREAIENGRQINLTVQNSDGTFNEGKATPISIGGKYLDIEADGFGMSIELDCIKKVV